MFLKSYRWEILLLKIDVMYNKVNEKYRNITEIKGGNNKRILKRTRRGEHQRKICFVSLILCLSSLISFLLVSTDKFLLAPRIKFKHRKFGDKFRERRYYGTLFPKWFLNSNDIVSVALKFMEFVPKRIQPRIALHSNKKILIRRG